MLVHCAQLLTVLIQEAMLMETTTYTYCTLIHSGQNRPILILDHLSWIGIGNEQSDFMPILFFEKSAFLKVKKKNLEIQKS